MEPSRDWLITGADAQVARTTGARVGESDVAAVSAMTQALTDLDHRFGSGHVRPVVVHYLNSVVSGLLAGSYRESVGRELFAAVARLTELAGYMAVDTGQPGLAQRYYIQALRLAQAAGDRGYGGYVLAASMSHLAAQLGNPREIAQLARAAQEGARGHVTPRAEAMFYAAEARGHALMGDAAPVTGGGGPGAHGAGARRGTRGRRPGLDRALRRGVSRRRVGALPPGPGAAGGGRPACQESLDGHPETRARRRAIGLVLLATAQVQQREVEQACHTGTRAVELLGTLRSNRGAEYLEDLQQRLEPYGTSRWYGSSGRGWKSQAA